jgi:hypothetical protein
MAGYEKMPPGNDYNQRDFQMLFQQTDAHDWSDAIHWLEGNGAALLPSGHAASMLLDLQQLQQEDVHFVRDPLQAYDLAKQKHAD